MVPQGPATWHLVAGLPGWSPLGWRRLGTGCTVFKNPRKMCLIPKKGGGGMMSPAEDNRLSDVQKDNRLSDVQNLLGFLLAGFGGVLSFIGLRSTEVTTVLRNNSKQASLI